MVEEIDINDPGDLGHSLRAMDDETLMDFWGKIQMTLNSISGGTAVTDSIMNFDIAIANELQRRHTKNFGLPVEQELTVPHALMHRLLKSAQ